MKHFFITLLVLVSLQGISQEKELGEVTVEELSQKKHPSDTSAVAAVIFEKGKTYFEYKQDDGFKVITEVEVKIKIYKKEGFDWGNKEIQFYVGGQRDESVMISKAVTYNLVNGQIEKTKLKSDGEFIEKRNKFWSSKKIIMPNIKEGSIIEYKYILKSPFISSLPDWSFQNEIPVNYSQYKVIIPEYFKYNTYKKGNISISEQKSKSSRTVTLVFKSRTNSNFNGSVASSSRDFQEVVINEDQIIYKAEKVPALKDETFVNNIQNYTSSIQHELGSTQFPDTPFKLYSTDWETVTKKIYEDSDFGTQLNKTGYFENELKSLLNGTTERDEKIAKIFAFVKSKMNWDNFRSYNCDKGVSQAYSEKNGNSAEINLMLIAMLRYAGVDASPIILSTRNNGIALFPSLTAFDYVIAGVEIPDGLILLDATSKNSMPNILPVRDLNWFGRIIRKDGTSAQIDLSPNVLSKEYTNLMATISPSGELSGMIKSQSSDYNAFIFRDGDGKLTQDSYLEKLEKQLNNSEVEGYTIENKTDLSKPIIETFSFKNTNSTETIGDKIYFSPLLFFGKTSNPFKQEKREYPIDFVYPHQEKYLNIINIPEGYQVETIPTPVNIVFTDELLTYKYNITSNGKQIQVSSVLDIKTSILPSEDYEELKKFYEEMIKKQTEKVVLKKI